MASNESVSKSKKQDTSFSIKADDAILSMIDSLMASRYFESIGFESDTSTLNIYGYASDSVPAFSDSIYQSRMAELNEGTPMNLVYNRFVKAFINLYANKKRELTSRVLGLAPAYFPMFEETLDQYNMPLELKYLAVVESALTPVARSRVGAQGLWQFMYRTGRLYGLQVSSYHDDRMDPYLATHAACRYMMDLYKMYGDWELVLAAYNSGPGNVNRAIRRSGGKRNYWQIRPYLPRETRGYVPAFIAVNYVMNFHKEHNLYPKEPDAYCYQTDTVHLRQSMSFEQLSTYLDMPVEQIKYLNPAYKLDWVARKNGPKTLCLPVSQIGTFLSNETSIYADIRRKEVEDSLAGNKKQAIQPDNYLVHRVRSGEFLGSIANRYRVSVRDIMVWNNKRSTRINPGDRLTIYTSRRPQPKKQTSTLAQKIKPKPIKDGRYEYHVVRSGDTLWDIAKQYQGTSVTQLKQLNSNLNFRRLKPGMKVRVKLISS